MWNFLVKLRKRGGLKVEDVLTASQVAALLQVHLRTVYKLTRRGSIPGIKFGGGWRFSKAKILKMVAGDGGKDSRDLVSSPERKGLE